MKRTGRPTKTATESPTVIYTFRADSETIEALQALEAAVVGEGIVAGRRRSIAIRRALLEAHDRLRDSVRKL